MKLHSLKSISELVKGQTTIIFFFATEETFRHSFSIENFKLLLLLLLFNDCIRIDEKISSVKNERRIKMKDKEKCF